jgi:hypothetical protein
MNIIVALDGDDAHVEEIKTHIKTNHEVFEGNTFEQVIGHLRNGKGILFDLIITSLNWEYLRGLDAMLEQRNGKPELWIVRDNPDSPESKVNGFRNSHLMVARVELSNVLLEKKITAVFPNLPS